MRSVSLLGVLWAWTIVASTHGAAAPAAAPVERLVLELSDGSRIVGTAAIDRLKMATGYANFDIPLNLLRTVELSGTTRVAQVNFQNGDLLSGQLSATEIAMKTIFGDVVIPMTAVSRIRVGGGGKALPEGLVLYYTFDADEGGRVTDMSGCGNDGKVLGATFTNQGQEGGAMSFNGNREAVVIGSPTNLQVQDFTIMAWIKRGDLNAVTRYGIDANGLIFGYGLAGYGLGLHPNGNAFLTKISVDSVGADFEIHDEVFHHLVVTKQGSRVVFYLDGVAHPAPDYDADFEFNTDASVGGRIDNLTNTFLGVIDDIAVFNRALSGDEVKSIYDSQK